MSNKGQLLQDPFLNTLRREHVPVSIYLVNGIKLQGQIESFDQYVVLLAQHRDPDGLQARHLHHRARPGGELLHGRKHRSRRDLKPRAGRVSGCAGLSSPIPPPDPRLEFLRIARTPQPLPPSWWAWTWACRISTPNWKSWACSRRPRAWTPVARVVCKRKAPDAALFIGKGKADEIKALAEQTGATEVLFDQSLSPAQQRNLERHLDRPVNDRTLLILEIFAQRARSHEGKLQVELARLQYVSTRLVRRWSHLERQTGGAGVRGGPGEKQIELDRRMIGDAIKRTRERLEKVKSQRQTQRRQRERRGAFNISLVGYTNAGKSTLFNAPGQGPRLCRRPAVRDARHHHAPALPGRGRPLGVAVRHGRVHPRPAARPDRRLPGHLAGSGRRRPAAARGRCRQSRLSRADRRGAARAARDRRGRRAAGAGVQQDRPARPEPAAAPGQRPCSSWRASRCRACSSAAGPARACRRCAGNWRRN